VDFLGVTMPEQKPLIVMRSGPIPGSSFYLEKTEVTLGRDLANDIPVPDQEISRRHARFVTRTDGVYVEDLGSTNGTFLNGVRISSPQRLNNGDLITLAEATVMSFEWPDQAKTPTYSAYPVAESIVQPAQAIPQAAFQPAQKPIPQQPLTPGLTPEAKYQKPWYSNFFILLLIAIILIMVIVIFMPESWWCFFSANGIDGCPVN